MEEQSYQRWVCDACGFIYDEAKGDPDSGLSPGTRYADIPDEWQCPLCGLGKSDLRLLPDQPKTQSTSRWSGKAVPQGKSKGGEDYIIIVGAGIAGWSTAETIRNRNAETPILLISACPGASYPKPALSTALAKKKLPLDLVEQDATSKANALGIEILTDTRVLKIDPTKKRLTTAKGGLQYGKLILALGAHQRELPLGGDAVDQVVKVNDLASYERFRKRLEDGVKHVTIIGAGLIGCEFAEDLLSSGYQVSLLDMADSPMASLLPASIASELKKKLHQKGIDWHLSTSMDSLEKCNGRLRATLSNGDALETDLVLSAAGLVANCQLAEKAGITVSKGIITDRSMRCSAPDTYAIGDCAEVEGQVFAYIEPIRRQAQAIAADLFGEPEPFIPLPPLIRVKTPSYPLCICPPASQSSGVALTPSTDRENVWEYRSGEKRIGFICLDNGVESATKLYRETFY